MPMSDNNAQPESSIRVGKAKLPVAKILEGETLSELIHKIGHETGNPLTSIISMGTVLSTISSGSSTNNILEKTLKYSNSIIDEAWRISRLNERLVMLLSRRTGNATLTEVAPCAEKTIKKLRGRYKKIFKPLKLEFEIEEPSPKAVIDELQLMVIFSELFTNAAEATKDNSLNSPKQTETLPTKVSIYSKEKNVVLEVTSISKNKCPYELDSLFDPFVTKDTDKKPIGLCLTVCQAIAERFGGTIEVKEELTPKGYTFKSIITLAGKELL